MTPTLPETLARLALLVPKRVSVDTKGTAGTMEVYVQTRTQTAPHIGIYDLHEWVFVGYSGPAKREWERGVSVLDQRLVRVALEEEIEARGWNWAVSRQGRNPDGTWQYWGRIWHPFRSRPEVAEMADSPAAALALALLAALEAERGEG